MTTTLARSLVVSFVIAAPFAFVAVGACRTQGRDGKEPRAIAQAFDDFENASPSDRRAALAALKGARCTDPADCADRDACTLYASSLLNANELASKAKALGPEDAGGSGAATPTELGTIISAADDALKQAEKARAPCLEALDRLHRHANAQ